VDLCAASILSPFWWTSVVAGSLLFGLISLRVADRWCGRPRSASRDELRILATALRLRVRAGTFLMLANLGMWVGLGAVNLHTPSLAGPVGLAFVLLCLVCLLSAVLHLLAATRVERWARREEGPDAKVD